MSDQTFVSRRRASRLIAGSLAVSASAGFSKMDIGNVADAADADESSALRRNVEADLLALLSRVRVAGTTPTRVSALRQLQTALLFLDGREAGTSAGSDGVRSLRLYRQRTPCAVLATVIARELEDWPRSDPRWGRRFADLQSAVREWVGTA